MKAILISVAFASLSVASAGASAQEQQPERATDARFYWVEMIKFHPGKIGRAGELARKYFIPVDKEIGTRTVSIHMNTGEWDYVTLFQMVGGPDDISWRTSPQDIKFMNALARHAGGTEAAQKLLDEWDSLIARREAHVAHMHE